METIKEKCLNLLNKFNSINYFKDLTKFKVLYYQYNFDDNDKRFIEFQEVEYDGELLNNIELECLNNLYKENGLDDWNFLEIYVGDLVNYGNLDLSNSDITALPDSFVVYGTLDLSDSKIKTLPDNLKVGGDLDLIATNISALPQSLIVDGDLYIVKSKIRTIPAKLKVSGEIYIS